MKCIRNWINKRKLKKENDKNDEKDKRYEQLKIDLQKPFDKMLAIIDHEQYKEKSWKKTERELQKSFDKVLATIPIDSHSGSS